MLEFADYFNLCPVSLFGTCGGPTDTFFSLCGRYRSTLDYIFVPNCLFNEIRSAKTFDLCTENTSDPLPIMVKLNQREFPDCTTTVSDEWSIAFGKRPKIQWSKFSSEKIHDKYVIPLLSDLSEVDMCDLIVSETAADKLSLMLIDHSLSLVSSVPSTRKKTSKKISYVKLPDDVKAARPLCKTAFGSWKNHDFPSVGGIHDTYRCLCKEYRLLMRNFLNNLESNKVMKLCNAAKSDQKLFWKLLKGQRSSSLMSAFLVKDKLIMDKSLIREMLVNHFEALGTPSNSENFDSNFLARVTASV